MEQDGCAFVRILYITEGSLLMRKSILALLIALAMILCAIPAMAESDAITEITTGTQRDFDGDGITETLIFTPAEPNEYDEMDGFTIAVGDDSYSVDETWNLEGTIYAVNLGGGMYYDPEWTWGTLFMVPEYGYTYCYLYTGGHLLDVGAIPSLPMGMTADADGRITCHIRASHIGTWHRFAEYKLANGYKWDENGDFETYYHIAEIPQDTYAMGMIVTLNQNLSLKATRFDSEASIDLAAGQQIILVASDDVRWLYVSNMDGSIGGWVEFNGPNCREMINVNGACTDIDDVFEHILYAD